MNSQLKITKIDQSYSFLTIKLISCSINAIHALQITRMEKMLCSSTLKSDFHLTHTIKLIKVNATVLRYVHMHWP